MNRSKELRRGDLEQDTQEPVQHPASLQQSNSSIMHPLESLKQLENAQLCWNPSCDGCKKGLVPPVNKDVEIVENLKYCYSKI
ncbi:hypothetical protein Ancab_019490 [Ancistrocladus abbreviatus]